MLRKSLLLAVLAALSACGEAPTPAEQESAAEQAATPANENVASGQVPTDPIDAILDGAHRSEANKARDGYRHPKETLAFFGIAPDMTVIEITPGGGWYTEILGPYLRDSGKLIAATWDSSAADAPEYYKRNNQAFADKLAGHPAQLGQVELRAFDTKQPSFGETGSADAVVTFRNVHNWAMDGNDAAYFRAFFDVLKPGGVLGVVEHRANPGTSLEQTKESGYLTEEYVIGLATAAGFMLEEKSEINANPKDTKDYKGGVWTLPPSLGLGDEDRERYLAIGESDRMTLRFRKASAGEAVSEPAAETGAEVPGNGG